MNDFERLLHGVLDGTNNFWDARYIGRACYAPITEDLRIKAEFQSTLVAAQYNALKLTTISNKNGVIDTLTLYFSDFFPEANKLKAFDTKKYIWTDCGKTEWYVKPKPQELEAMAQAADDYATQFDPEMAIQIGMTGMVLHLLQSAKICMPEQRHNSLEARRLENEIQRLLDTPHAGSAMIRGLIFDLAAEKYRLLTEGLAITDKLRTELAPANLSSSNIRRTVMETVRQITLIDDDTLPLTEPVFRFISMKPGCLPGVLPGLR